jgi:hypothetical protein
MTNNKEGVDTRKRDRVRDRYKRKKAQSTKKELFVSFPLTRGVR